MNIPEKKSCDLCGRVYERALEVRGNMALDNGGKIVIVPDACRKCVDVVLKLLAAAFPKASFIERVMDESNVPAE